jgi:hypothetical protein
MRMSKLAGMVLPPAPSPIEATAAEQKNDDDNDEKRGHVHDFSFGPKANLILQRRDNVPTPSSKGLQDILEPAGCVLNVAGRIFVPAFDQARRRPAALPTARSPRFRPARPLPYAIFIHEREGGPALRRPRPRDPKLGRQRRAMEQDWKST